MPDPRRLLACMPFLAGCGADFALPQTAEIACGDGRGCPPGFLCKPAIGRCVPTAALDQEPPALTGPVRIEPEVGTVGTTFSVCVDVSEPLAAPPVVHLEAGTRVATLAAAEDSGSGEALSHCFRYVSDGSELPGERALTVDLMDRAGNPAVGLAAGSLTLDFTPPHVASAQLGASVAREDQQVELELHFDEDLASSPQVRLSPEGASPAERDPAWTAASAEGARRYLLTWTPTGDEAQGAHTVWLVRAEDRPGNASEPTPLGGLVLDFAPPAILDDPGVSVVPRVASLGRTVSVELWTDEELGGELPSLRGAGSGAGSLEFSASQVGVGWLRFLHTVAAGSDGSHDLRLSGLTDVAGNELEEVRVGELVVDTSPPRIEALRSDAPVYSAREGFDLVTLSFDVDESLDGDGAELEVLFGGEGMACGAYQGPTGSYVCSHAVTAADEHGPVQIRVAARDAAGNQALASTAIELDQVSPEVEATVTPSPIKLGDHLELVVETSEPLGTPVLATARSAAGELDLGEPEDFGRSLVFRHRVQAADDDSGRYEITLLYQDQVGNPGNGGEPEVVVRDVRLDATPPAVLSELTRARWGEAWVEPSDAWSRAHPLADGGSLELRFVVREAFPGAAAEDVELLLEGATVGWVEEVPLPEGLNDGEELTAYSARYEVEAEDWGGQDGGRTAAVVVWDEAGNRAGPVELGRVHLDFRCPEVMHATLALGAPLGPDGLPLLERVTGLTRGSRLDLALALSEPIRDGTLSVWASRAAGASLAGRFFLPDDEAHLRGAGGSWVYEDVRLTEGQLPLSPAAQGPWTLYLSATDVAGNTTDAVDLTPALDGGLVVDTLAPESPESEAVQARLLYRRAPWGSASPATPGGGEGRPEYAVSAQAGAFEPVAQVFLWERLAGGSYLPLLVRPARTNGQGGFDAPAALAPVDRESVFVSVADDAGNTSARALVRNVEWVATLGLKEPGDPTRNPHRLLAVPLLPDVLFPSESALVEEVGAGPLAGLRDGLETRTSGRSARRWRERERSLDRPEPRWCHALAHDPARGESLLFGGLGAGGWLGDTWVRRGTDWLRQEPLASPPARADHALAYDRSRGRFVLFGGRGGDGSLADTWEWDGAGWHRLDPQNAPSARAWHAMSFDPTSRSVLLFGGYDETGRADTWRWDGTDWTRLGPAAAPTPRGAHVLATDGARGRVVLFGGWDGRYLGDTWEWDGETWWPLQPDEAPAERCGGSMAFDSVRGRVVLFGGDGWDGRLRDTWTWDGAAWSSPEEPEQPPARSYAALVHDEARERTLLFGGYAGGVRGDAWEWDGEAWSPAPPDELPSARHGHGMAYDEVRGRVVLFGGQSSDSDELVDTWEWDGTSWLQRAPARAPPGRRHHTMAYDAARSRVVVVGGRWQDDDGTSDLWEWDGRDWRGGASGDRPSWRRWAGMAYDPWRARLVFFGGWQPEGFRNDTWEWDGHAWHRRDSGPRPAAREHPAMAFDGSRILLFGGYGDEGRLSDSWAWDGWGWQQLQPAHSPAARSSFAMVRDTRRGRVVLFGGRLGSESSNDTWEWYGGDWHPVAPAHSPPPRHGHAMAYDRSRDRVVVHGGWGLEGLQGDTWEWDGLDWRQAHPPGTPVGRTSGSLHFDGASVVQFGGSTPMGKRGDTWIWDGRGWRELGTDASPSARYGHAVAFDPQRGVSVLFGGWTDSGLANDTWESEGGQWHWHDVAVAPQARYDHAVAGGGPGVTLLFGGASFTPDGDELVVDGDTWAWDGHDWLQLQPAHSPIARSSHAMVRDTARGVTVLFGGFDGLWVLGDTWEWDSADWRQHEPDHSPPVQSGHALAYDSSRGTVILLGKDSDGDRRGDTWEWDGADWRRLDASFGPPARDGHGLSYDPLRQLVVLSGGEVGDARPHDTWTLPSLYDARPGHLLAVDFAAAGAGPGTSLLSLQASLYAGGSGMLDGAHTPGAQLLAWNPLAGRWQPTVGNDSDVDQPDLLEWTSESPDEIERLLFDDTFHVAVAPEGENGTGYAEVVTDYAEVVIRYRLP